MSLMKEIFSGYAHRVRLENSLRLQEAKIVRPEQVKLDIAAKLTAVEAELTANPQLKAKFDSVKLTVPE